jgi:hypothetical protein
LIVLITSKHKKYMTIGKADSGQHLAHGLRFVDL